MKPPIARPLSSGTGEEPQRRSPRAFAPDAVPAAPETVEVFSDLPDLPVEPPAIGRMRWPGRVLWGAGGLLVSLGLGLAAERLIGDLFARYEWLGWLGFVALVLFALAAIVLVGREIGALRRLRALDRLRLRATETLLTDDLAGARSVTTELAAIYAQRPDLERPLKRVGEHGQDILDGADLIRLAEETLMAPLDGRARALTSASARRVALVTAVSPRALVDVAFVGYESVRLAGAIARLYGVRPGLIGYLRLTGAVLSHLAVTGGLAAGDGLIEQVVGQGLAARVSSRLGEGLVNALMTARVGIAAMLVVRPLPYAALERPRVREFIPELVKVMQKPEGPAP